MLLKILYEKGTISPDELSKLLADDNVGIAVQVTNISGVKFEDPIPLPSGLVEMEALIDTEVEQILGLGVNQFGEYAPGSADRSATEANIVNQATQIRIDERRDACADLMVDYVADMNDDIAEYWDESMIVDVAGPAGVPIWIKFQPELIRQGRFDVKVDPDSSVPLTKQYKEQKAAQGFAMFKDDPFVDQHALREFVLSQIWGYDADSILLNPAMQTSPQNPMSIQQAAQHLQQMPQPGGRPPLQSIQGGKQ
jgi:hypothetical protein